MFFFFCYSSLNETAALHGIFPLNFRIFRVFCNLVAMKVKCRGCNKTYSTKSNRNKHKRAAGHGLSETGEREIPYNSENGVYLCPTANCIITATTKRSIKRHFKNVMTFP